MIDNLHDIIDEFFPKNDELPSFGNDGGSVVANLKIPLRITKGVFKNSVGLVNYSSYYYIDMSFGTYPGTDIDIRRRFTLDYVSALPPNTPLQLQRKKSKLRDATGKEIAVGKLATYKNKICMVVSTTPCGKVCISYMTRRGRTTNVVSSTQIIGIEELNTSQLRSDLTVQFLTS